MVRQVGGTGDDTGQLSVFRCPSVVGVTDCEAWLRAS